MSGVDRHSLSMHQGSPGPPPRTKRLIGQQHQPPKTTRFPPKEFNTQELQELRTAFELIDANGDGHITKEEFSGMLRKFGVVLSDDCIEEVLRCASRTGKEHIDENDFIKWIRMIEELRPDAGFMDENKQLMDAFRVFDLDKNGYITRDELRAAMDLMGEKVSESQLTEYINMADIDKDGKINYEEFARLLKY